MVQDPTDFLIYALWTDMAVATACISSAWRCGQSTSFNQRARHLLSVLSVVRISGRWRHFRPSFAEQNSRSRDELNTQQLCVMSAMPHP